MTTKFYTNVSQYGNSLLVRGFDSAGKRFKKKVKYQPYLFIQSKEGDGHFDVHGNPMMKVEFESISEARDFLDTYKDVDNGAVYGLERWPYLYIYDTYKKMVPDISKLNLVALDIEVLSDEGFPEPEEHAKPVTAITLRKGKKRYVLGCQDYTPKDNNVVYYKCKDERDLLLKFLEIWEFLDPDVITGWNIEMFDIPYLYLRICKILSEKAAESMSPWRVVNERKVFGVGGSEHTIFDIVGIANMDYMKVYKKFNLDPRESFALDYICQVELGEKKLDYKSRGFKNLNEFYEKDFEGYIDYNIRDTDLIFALEEYKRYLEQAFTLAYDSCVNFTDALTTVQIWDVIIHNYLMDKKIVVSPKNNNPEDHHIEGGYVKEPQIGLHKWVVSLDLDGLYPHLIMQYNISPETRVRYNDHEYYNVDFLLRRTMDMSWLKEHNITTTANRMKYRKDKHGFIPELMLRLYNNRKTYKEAMIEAKKEHEKTKSKESKYAISRNDNLQKAMKVLLNGCYGALANKYFRWYDANNAEAITTSGQLSIRWVAHDLNKYMNKILKTENEDYVIAIDTDSVYLSFDKIVANVFDDDSDTTKIVNFIDKVCKEKIQPVINKSYEDLAEYLNVYEQKMNMKRENIADKAIWTGKKRYIMNVWDSEGVRYEKAKLKIMGIEAIRSTTPSVCRDYIKESLKIIMNGNETELQNYVKKIREEFPSHPFDKISFSSSVNFMANKTAADGSKYRESYIDRQNIYRKGSPIQVKAALLHNTLIEKKGLRAVSPMIKDGEKIKYAYLKEPNPLHDTVIGSHSDLPKEFELDEFIDYNVQFEKGYLKPITSILSVINWQAEKRSTLESFFDEEPRFMTDSETEQALSEHYRNGVH